jgi:hypothetical protein
MVDLLTVRDGRRLALVPATDLDRDRMSRLLAVVPDDYPMLVRTIFTRTNKLNRWYRGVVGHAAEGLGVHPQSLHVDLKIKCGLVEHVMLSPAHRGVVHVTTRSTSFPEMDDGEFADYVGSAVPLIFRDYLPHVRSAQQKKLIAEWAGRRPKLEEPPKLIGFEGR